MKIGDPGTSALHSNGWQLTGGIWWNGMYILWHVSMNKTDIFYHILILFSRVFPTPSKNPLTEFLSLGINSKVWGANWLIPSETFHGSDGVEIKKKKS